MKRKILVILWALITSSVFGTYFSDKAYPREKLIKEGDLFPNISLQTPSDPKARTYLGLPEGKIFTIKDIKADLVLVEILSIYCPSCQEQTPIFNKLYELIEKNPKTKGRIKIIGIGAGNNNIEVNYFRHEYKIPFPLFPDPQFVMHVAIGGSRTPFSIYVRQDPSTQGGLVAGTHLGTNEAYEKLFNELAALMTTDLAAIREKGKRKKAEAVSVEPLHTEEELRAKVKEVLVSLNGKLIRFEKLSLKNSSQVYTGLLELEGGAERVFAEVVSRPSVCDVCHDVHFLYVFDSNGKVTGFVPLQLTKYDNELWDDADLEKMRERIVGRYLSTPFIFDPKVDAVSSATMTSALIFDSLSKRMALMTELKEKGLI